MKTIQKLMVLLVLTGICTAQPVPGEGDQSATKSKPHHKVAAKKTAAKVEPAASAEDIKQLKELIQAQQAQINDLKQLVTQHDQQTLQAQQAATDAQKTAVAAQEKAVATETVVADTNTKVDSVKADISDLKTTATNTAVTAQEEQKRVSVIEALNNRFRFSGDMRVRYENFFQRAAGPQDRERFRFRLRFGVDGKLNEDFIGGFALASGAQNDPTSTNQTLGDSGNSPDFERKTINIDRAYITWNPAAYKWFSATGGKFAYPWVRTNPTFDPDINPEGFTEKVAFKLAHPIVKEVSLTGLQLVLQTNNNSSLPNTDSWAYGGQIGTKLQLGSRWAMVPTYAVLNFVRPNAAIFGYTTATSTLTQFAPNNMDNCTAPVTYPNVTVAAGVGKGFCSQFLYSDLIVSNVVQTGIKSLPLSFIGEWEKNLAANPDKRNATYNTHGDNKIHDTLYYVEASLGQQKNKGDIQFGYAYTHTEKDAVISSFAESDSFHQTNNEQHRVFFNWRVRNNTTVGYTQWIGRYLDPTIVNSTAVTLPTTITNNPYLKRGQLDVVYTF